MQKGHVLFNNPANAYAISYPFGVLGLILMMVVSKYIFKINIEEEIKSFEAGVRLHHPTPYMVKCRVTNPFFFGKPIDDLLKMTHQKVIVSRLKHSGSSIIESPHFHTILKERDVLMLVGLPEDVELATKLVGRISSDKLIESELHTSSKIFIVTRNHAIHKTIEELDLEDSVGVHATRVYRSGLEMLASPSLVLHYGDQIKVVGDEESLKKMSVLVGNSSKHILEPQLLSIFLGIVLGIVVGSIPVFLPGLASPVKLGMAAGPLLVALVISRYGGIHTIHSYLNQSAILFMKDLGICLFFAVVGIHAGETFYETFITYNGWTWVAYGLTITMIPLMIMLLLARLVFKMNFIPLLGLMAGTYTDPAALAFSTTYYKTDLPTQAYATVYPMVTILRILVAQLLVLYFVK
jgi:putative transport protein